MPAATWVLIGVVLLVVGAAIGYIAVLRPLIASGKRLERIYPILNEIAAQFRSDSGTSMRDLMNRQEEASDENRRMMDALTMAAEHARVAAEASQTLLNKLDVRVGDATESVGKVVVVMDEVADEMSEMSADISDAQDRAGAHQETSPGSASDAAWRKPPSDS